MSIVFLSPTGQIGGAEAVLVDMVSALREEHPDWPLAVVAASEGPLVERLRTAGVNVDVVAFPEALSALGDWGIGRSVWRRAIFAFRCLSALWPALVYITRLRRRLLLSRPTVVHSNGMKMHVIAALARPSDAALVWHFHDYVGRRVLASTLLRHLAGRCSAIVTNSDSVAQDARHVCGHRMPIHTVWNALNLGRFAPSGPRLDLDALAGLPAAADGVLKVGMVATFARWKGHRTFLEAVALLPPELPVRAYVIGGPVYATPDSQVLEDDLRSLATNLGLGGRVGFTGFVTDPAAAMRALDVVVHASTDPEPFGLVIAEAMACGRAVVASGAGGAVELTRAGDAALTHQPGDVRGLARQIELLARDAGLRLRLGNCGRATAERAFTTTRMARELAPVYEAAVAGVP